MVKETFKRNYFIHSGITFKPIDLVTRSLDRSLGNLKGFNMVTDFFQNSLNRLQFMHQNVREHLYFLDSMI